MTCFTESFSRSIRFRIWYVFITTIPKSVCFIAKVELPSVSIRRRRRPHPALLQERSVRHALRPLAHLPARDHRRRHERGARNARPRTRTARAGCAPPASAPLRRRRVAHPHVARRRRRHLRCARQDHARSRRREDHLATQRARLAGVRAVRRPACTGRDPAHGALALAGIDRHLRAHRARRVHARDTVRHRDGHYVHARAQHARKRPRHRL